MAQFSDVPNFILENFFNVFEESDSSTSSRTNDVIIATEYDTFSLFIENEDTFVNCTINSIDSIEDNKITISSDNMEINGDIENGSNVYFKKGGIFHTFIKRNSTYQEYVNHNKEFIYLGTIYYSDDSYIIKYIHFYNFVLNALPYTNQTEKLEEFVIDIFDKEYSKIYNSEKNINSLITPKEINKDFIWNYAYNFGLNLNEDFISSNYDKVREFLSNIINYLKRKGTYTSININKEFMLSDSENTINIYDRWHSASVSGNPLEYFEDVNVLDYYNDDFRFGEYTVLDDTTNIIQKKSGSTWTIFHSLNTKNILSFCIDKEGKFIKPDTIEFKNSNIIKMDFDENIEGYFLGCKFEDSELLEASESYIDFSDVEIPLSTFTKEDFTFVVETEELENSTSLKVITNTDDEVQASIVTSNDVEYKLNKSSEWNIELENNAILYETWIQKASTEWKIVHDLDTTNLIIKCYDIDDKEIIPKNIEIFEKYIKCYFNEEKNGYVVLLEGNLKYISENSTWTTGIAGDNITQTFINDELEFPILNTTNEITFTNSSSGNVIYTEPDYIHEQNSYSNIWNIEHNLNSKYNGIEIKVPISSQIWLINHNIGDLNYLFECFDINDEKIIPSEFTKNENNIEISFDIETNGYVVISQDNRNTVDDEITNFEQTESNLIQLESNSSFVVLTSETENDSYEIETNIPHFISFSTIYEDETIIPNTKEIGDNYIKITNDTSLGESRFVKSDADYIHYQEEYSNIWKCNHPFNTKNVLSEFYSYIFKSYNSGETISFEHNLGNVISAFYEYDTNDMILPSDVIITNNDNTITIYFNEILTGTLSLMQCEKEEFEYSSNWFFNGTSNNYLTDFYDDSDSKIIPNSVLIEDNNITASLGISSEGYLLYAEADYIENIENKTSITITHNLETSSVIVQCIDSDNYKIKEYSVEIVDSNSVKVEFGTSSISGKILVGSAANPIYKVIPEKVTNKYNSIEAYFDDEFIGYCAIKYGDIYFNNTYKTEYPSEVELVDKNNSIVRFNESCFGKAYCKSSNFTGMYLQKSYANEATITNDDISISFDEDVIGILLYKEIGKIGLDSEILSPHIKIELDLSNQPEADNAILPQTTLSYLLDKWEEDKPVSRYYHYDLLLKPKVSLSSSTFTKLYSDEYSANCYTKCLSPLYAETQNTYLHSQIELNDRWTFTHTLSADAIIQIFNFENKRIYPNTIYQKNGYIEIDFDYEINGYVLCYVSNDTYEKTILSLSSTKANELNVDDILLNNDIYNGNNFTYVSGDNTISLEDSGSIVQYKQINNNIQIPDSIEYNEDKTSITLSFNNEIKGSFNILEDTVLYDFSDISPVSEWVINHNTGYKGQIITVLKDNKIIFPKEIQLKNSNTTIISFDEAQNGQVLMKSFGHIETAETLKNRLLNGKTELGNGTSKINYDFITQNKIESSVIESTVEKVYDQVLNIETYFDSNYEGNITEIGIYDYYTNDLLFYTFMNKIYKDSKTNIKIYIEGDYTYEKTFLEIFNKSGWWTNF